MIATIEATTNTNTTSPSSARLTWTFHSGFAAYVERLADGRVDVSGGVERLADGRFRFPFDAAGDQTGAGAVHWTGHHGMLAVTLADPAVEHTASGPVLTIADPFSPDSRMVLAELGAATRTETGLRYEKPILTEAGADLFMGHYQEGLALAPLEIEKVTR